MKYDVVRRAVIKKNAEDALYRLDTTKPDQGKVDDEIQNPFIAEDEVEPYGMYFACDGKNDERKASPGIKSMISIKKTRYTMRYR